jgi:hypothetical protein
MIRTRLSFVFATLAAVVLAGCDTRLPTASRRAAPGTPPSVVIDTPLVNTQVNLGDSIFVRVSAVGGNALKTLTIEAKAISGVQDLGTYAETPRFTKTTVEFPAGTTDTIIRRFINPINKGDQNLDSLVVIAILTDSLGLADTSRVRAAMVSGPNVNFEAPIPNDSVTPGVALSVAAHATDQDGVTQVSIRVQGEASWPTKLDTTMVQTFGGSQTSLTFTGAASIPANAPGRGRITISASAIDGNSQPGSAAPIVVFVKSAASVSAPLVTQVVPPRAERADDVTVTANGAGIVSVGLVVRDKNGTLISRDSVLLPAPPVSNVTKAISLKLPLSMQGQHVAVTAFAVDQSGRTGYAVHGSAAAVVTNLAGAAVDSATIVYGTTYDLPLPGTVGDLAVDVSHGNVFLSNTVHNRLDVWQNATKTFDPNGIPVGSLPWGLFVSATNPDTLLVANSGGTNISRVFIGTNSVANQREDLANRILTRNLFVTEITESRDNGTGKITIALSPMRSFSDRPQYIAQSTTGRIYFSTRPTSFAPEGTVRYIETDPSFPAPDPRIVWQYVDQATGTDFRYTIFNIDSTFVIAASPNSTASDVIVMYDHPYGQTSGVICVNGPGCPVSTTDGRPVSAGGIPDASVEAMINTMIANGSDLDYGLRLDLTQLPLKDTTFVAASFDNHWFAFGEGNSAPAVNGARVIVVADSIPAPTAIRPQFLSPRVTVRDLTENASERVFGLGLDQHGANVMAHGLESYLSEVGNPFHLRLQGKYDSKDDGAGVAFHPLANGRNTNVNSRLAFVASSSGQIEAVDVAYFINRGTYSLKYPIYGPLRASLPMAGDDPSVVLKLFALTQRGLVVIDITQADIKAGPP